MSETSHHHQESMQMESNSPVVEGITKAEETDLEVKSASDLITAERFDQPIQRNDYQIIRAAVPSFDYDPKSVIRSINAEGRVSWLDVRHVDANSIPSLKELNGLKGITLTNMQLLKFCRVSGVEDWLAGIEKIDVIYHSFPSPHGYLDSYHHKFDNLLRRGVKITQRAG